MCWTDWALNPGGGQIFRAPRLALGPIQTHVQWVPGLFLGVKWLGHGTDYPSPSSVKVKERLEHYLYSPSEPS